MTLNRTTSGGGSGTIIHQKYQLNHLLGRGSFAKVYHATSLSDNSPIAIKVIDKSPDPTLEPRLISEVSAMRRLSRHPNILNLHEVMASKSKIYLVMELAAGGEISAKIARHGRMPEPTARRFFQQLINTLHFCHRNGVAHRDLKPQNLLLSENGNLKVSDFGLSSLSQKEGIMLSTACGTPAYTAPEVVRRKGYDGGKADAWSCGVILYVFLVGYLPFDDSNLPNMYKKIYHKEYKFPDWVSKPARHLISRLLDPNPDTRMSVEGVMGTSWFKKKLSLVEGGGGEEDIGKVGLFEEEEEGKCDTSLNAFSLISMSSGLDLSGLFEGELRRKERRFTTRSLGKEVEDRVRRVGGELGYRVEKGKGRRDVVLVKGNVVILVRIMEFVSEVDLLMVELKVVSGEEEVDEFVWEELKLGFGDIIVSWHNDVCLS